MAGPSKVAEGTGLNAQAYRQIKIIVPAKNQELRITRGVSPRHLAPSPRSEALYPPAHAGQAGAFSCRPTVGAIAPPFTTVIPARSPPLPGLTGRSITMDEWLCQSGRRPGPNDRCGTADGDTVMPSADEVRGRRERTSSPSRGLEPISASAAGRSTSRGQGPRCITLPNDSLRIRRSEYQQRLPACWVAKP